MTAQQSRIALRAWGYLTSTERLEAYYEMDFLGAAVDANNRESNGFTPRIRQGFEGYDNDDYHIHFLAGQAWSLMTQNRVGITPGYENIPLTIDAQYVVGLTGCAIPSSGSFRTGTILLGLASRLSSRGPLFRARPRG